MCDGAQRRIRPDSCPETRPSSRFAPVSERDLRRLIIIASTAGRLGLPESVELRLHQVTSRLSGELEAFGISRIGIDGRTALEIRQSGRSILFPEPLPRIKMRMIAAGYLKWLRSKYALPGFAEVEPGDVVVDCGAYVGGFGLSVQHLAAEVHMFEPSSENYRCADLNAADDENVFVYRLGLGDSNDTRDLLLSDSGVEHSFLAPDSGYRGVAEVVSVARLDSIWQSLSDRRVTFLKIEAEGLEPEVLDGAINLGPQKVAIDVSPERDGESPAHAVMDKLVEHRYRVKVRGNVLFARRDA